MPGDFAKRGQQEALESRVVARGTQRARSTRDDKAHSHSKTNFCVSAREAIGTRREIPRGNPGGIPGEISLRTTFFFFFFFFFFLFFFFLGFPRRRKFSATRYRNVYNERGGGGGGGEGEERARRTCRSDLSLSFSQPPLPPTPPPLPLPLTRST
jgi:hypothetical protein